MAHELNRPSVRQTLLKHGVEIVFLNHTMGASPESDLLLQMQGMFAEYERAKILERSRRGKRHAAQRGSVNVLSAAPYGYRYITKQEGHGTAAYEVIEEQAAVVKQVFEWVGCDRLSITSRYRVRWRPAEIVCSFARSSRQKVCVAGAVAG